MSNTRIRAILFSVGALLAMVAVVRGSDKNQDVARLPRCVGPFCPASQHWTKSRLAAKYGLGARVQDKVCYKDPVENTFVQFDFSGGRSPTELADIFVSKTKNCTSVRMAQRTFGNLATPEGIAQMRREVMDTVEFV